MAFPIRPVVKPVCSTFSSGPTPKRPGWSSDVLSSALVGRSHRSDVGLKRIQYAIDLTRDVLEVPSDYKIAIVPASDTGAVEMSLWNLLGPRGVDVLAWESFGADWVYDICEELKLSDVRVFDAPAGQLPDFKKVNFDRDVVFVWNGTTSGACIPNKDFIPANRKGLTICDATSAVFAQRLDLRKLDVITFSWQKSLGGEGAHGVLILSPNAIQRLESWTPPWPLPKIFRITSKKKLISGIFEGKTINTPSMLCLEDYIDTLEWGKKIGGLEALIIRAEQNFSVVDQFVSSSSWLAHLVEDPCARSNTSVCLSIVDPYILSLEKAAQASFAQRIVLLLEREEIAYDIGAYRDSPPGLRIWCGPTVEKSDLEKLMPWLDWAFFQENAALCF